MELRWVMGVTMVARLLSVGYNVSVYAPILSKAENFRCLGADIVPSPTDAACSRDVVFTMVGHPSDVRSVVLDPIYGALAVVAADAILVDCISSDPAQARENAAEATVRGCLAVDASASCGDVGAKDGKLAIFAGGDE